MEADNGVLAMVPGESISAGQQQLPLAKEVGQPGQRQTVTVSGVRDLGDTMITYEVHTYRHGRSRLWHWVAVHAVRLGATQ